MCGRPDGLRRGVRGGAMGRGAAEWDAERVRGRGAGRSRDVEKRVRLTVPFFGRNCPRLGELM